MQVNYIEVLALLLLLLAAPLVFLNWLFGGHTASLLACWNLFRHGACAAAAEILVILSSILTANADLRLQVQLNIALSASVLYLRLTAFELCNATSTQTGPSSLQATLPQIAACGTS